MDYKAAVFIGRFQPFHNAHLDVVKHGLSIAEKVIIVVGSSNAAPNVKNPFSFEERADMIRDSLSAEDRIRVHIVGVRDYFYSDSIWVADIQAKVSQHVSSTDTVALLGNFKDSSSYYLKYFPQWEFTPVRAKSDLNATDIRDYLFETGEIDNVALPEGVVANLEIWKRRDSGARLKNMMDEFKFIRQYKTSWANAPYQPTFVTTDTVVIQSGHVLVVRRKFNPGKGLLALPGGFVRGGERLQDAAIRELKEETGIKVDKLILNGSVKDTKVFDHPGRSLRGRTITHAYYIRLLDGELPEVKGSDDAEGAFWMPLMDLGRNETNFYEDHFHIISYFVNKG